MVNRPDLSGHPAETPPRSSDASPQPESPAADAPRAAAIGGRVAHWLLFCLAPVTVVLAGLALWGHLDPIAAAVAWLIAAAITAMLFLPTLVDLARLLSFVHDLSQGRTPPQPDMRSRAGNAAALALAQVRRETRQSLAAADVLVRSHEGVFDALPDAVVMLDEDHRVVRANQAARSLFGRSLAGRDVSSLVRHPPILEALDEIENGGRELEFSLPLPVERRFIVSIQPLPGEIAEDAAILISFHDITTIRRMEQMRADFVANASHELRTPLSSLIGFIDTLRGPAHDDAEARERFLGIMAEQAARMARLIEDLLSLSRIELNEHTQPAHEVDVRRAIASVIDGLEPKAKERRVSVSIAGAEQVPPVRGEPDELTQVFQNLIENAVKYTREDTAIVVSIAALDHGPVAMPKESQGPVVAVSIRDRGEGIPQEHIPRLTERFYRVDSARSRKMGGTGLGLAIVKHVMNRHRGVLTIDSSVGLGSVFTVYLPVAQAAAAAEDLPPPRTRAGRTA